MMAAERALRAGTEGALPLVARGARVLAVGSRIVGRRLLDLALPPVCCVCERPLAEDVGLCMPCWSRLTLIERPYCERLGTPLAYDIGPGALSAAAIAEPPPFGRARAVCVHDEISRALVHGLKYRDRLELAPLMARWMLRASDGLVHEANLIVPVPLHPRRLWRRRFNQSALLAREIGSQADRPVLLEGLQRIRATPRQVGLDAAARAANVRGAFKVDGPHRAALEGRRILLVDDVVTTGATLGACVRALVRAGAASVDVLTFARVHNR
ncbi:ComF family protein [Breoghania sp. L-A4]|uniref:ComF family protein n=1 Tax=Breoghania sp. L-A4 TaxID=2304600 RepID=UPI000E35BDE0|nr:ComF family protein [Breoghania sp. L-A4]AXS42030.1 ComF family protein [Breoghania sp. L-A4]